MTGQLVQCRILSLSSKEKFAELKIGNASLKSQGYHNLCAVTSFKETCRARKVFTIDTFEPSQINSLEK